jgi:hypothetical protein
MKKIISIDIGLRNCSFSCVSKEFPDSKYQIHLWNNFNFLDEPIEKCKSLTKKGLICGKDCKFKSDDEYFCGTHLDKKSNFKELKKKLVDSFTMQEISLIVLNKITEIYNDNRDIFKDLDKILIEKQVRASPKMIMVSNLVFGKLTELLQDTETLIRFVSASKKALLFGIDVIDSKINGTLKGKKGYVNRKKSSIEFVTTFLQNDKIIDSAKWLDLLQNERKSDDLCDAFMYSISELMGNDIIKKNKKKVKVKST